MRVQEATPGVHVVGEIEFDLEAGQHAFVGSEPRIVGTLGEAGIESLIGVAEQRGRVAGPTSEASDVVEAIVERRAVGHHTVVALVEPGVQARPGRRTRSAL
ncbi:MAG: hypothetical protein R2705_19495 [Ilumatobacteraceae bacterium]